ncbi:MAG: PorT family protein [Bacteroidales bacterium]|nr:PorT family protein [Bacteroidales bacterium]
MKKLNFIKLLVLTLLLLAAPAMLFSQYSIGLKGGVNMADLSGSSVENNSSLMGYNFGGVFNYSLEDAISSDFGKIFSLQAELYMETKGANADYMFVDTTKNLSDVPQNFTYVTIPVLAKFSFGNAEKFQVYVNAGVYFSSLFGLTIDGEKMRDHDKNVNTDQRKYREEYAGFDMGLQGGAGIAIPFGDKFKGFLDARYSAGMANVGEYKATAKDIPEAQLEEIKTNTISASVGIMYKIK